MLQSVIALLLILSSVEVLCGGDNDGLMIAPSNVNGQQALLFNNSNADLPWPIANSVDPGLRIVHGPHCVEVINNNHHEHDGNQPADIVQIHRLHCQLLLQRVVSFLKQENINIPESICKALKNSFPVGSPLLMVAKTTVRFGNYSEGEQVQAKAAAAKQVYDQIVEELQPTNQQQIFDYINGYNYAGVFLKQWSQKQLTSAEQQYVDSWMSEDSVRLAALGVVCMLEGKPGDQNVVQYLLKTLEKI